MKIVFTTLATALLTTAVWAQTAGKIKDPMKRQFAIQALKAKFLNKDIRQEHTEMGYYSDDAIHDDL